MKRILITGAAGFFGSRLLREYRGRRDGQFFTIGAGREELNVTDEDAVRSFVEEACPDYILHCAAVSDVGACESQEEISERINVQGTVNLARACKSVGGKLIFMSSDQIYTGAVRPGKNREDALAAPINVYGRQKLRAEQEILSILPDTVCLRLAWMYDLPGRGLKTNNNLLCRLLRALIRNEAITLPENDFRGITYVWEAVGNMDQVFTLPGGVYNYGSENSLSTYETAADWLACLKSLPAERGSLIMPGRFRFQEECRNLAMDMGKMRAAGIDFADTRAGFLKCAEDYGLE